MPASTVDALLSILPPARPPEALPREAATEPFGPTLREAVDARAPRAESKSSVSPSDEETSRDASSEQQGFNNDLQAAASDDEASPVEEPLEQDAVEISEAAAAAPGEQSANRQRSIRAEAAADVIVASVADDAAVTPKDAEAEMHEGEGKDAATRGTTAGAVDARHAAASGDRLGRQAKESLSPTGTGAEHTSSLASAHDPSARGNDQAADAETGIPHAPKEAGGKLAAQQDAKTAESSPSPRRRDRPDDAPAVTNLPRVEAIAATTERLAAPDASAALDPASADAAAKPAEPVAATTPNAARATTSLERFAVARSAPAPAPPGGDHESLPPADRARFLQRVEGAMRRAVERDGRLQVRLAPPELGSLRIELTLQNGVMSARLETETATAKNLLLDNLPALRERLAAQDVRVERFDVDVRRDGGGNGGGPHDRPDGQSAPRQQAARTRHPPTHESTSPAASRGPGKSSSTTNGLDVRV